MYTTTYRAEAEHVHELGFWCQACDAKGDAVVRGLGEGATRGLMSFGAAEREDTAADHAALKAWEDAERTLAAARCPGCGHRDWEAYWNLVLWWLAPLALVLVIYVLIGVGVGVFTDLETGIIAFVGLTALSCFRMGAQLSFRVGAVTTLGERVQIEL